MVGRLVERGIRSLVLWSGFLLLLVLPLSAQIKVKVEPQLIMAGKRFQISYQYSGREKVSFTPPTLPRGLSMIYKAGPEYVRSQMIINGKASSEEYTLWSLTLIADEPGNYQIPAASFTTAKGEQKTKAVSIKVSPSVEPSKGKPVLALEPVLSKRTVYLEEPIRLRYRLYHTLDRLQPTFIPEANIDGTRFVLLEGHDKGIASIERYKGRNVKSYLMGNILLYPQKVGRIEIPAQEATVRYQEPSDDGIDQILLGGMLSVAQVHSSPVEIEVLPLPELGKPQNFSGAVGEHFSISLEQVTREAKTNEGLELKLVLKGNGGLKMASLPTIHFPESFDSYDPKEQSSEAIGSEDVSVERSLTYYVTPRKVGTFEIPPIEFSYFSPSKKAYQTVATSPLKISVSKGKTSASVVSTEGSGADEVLVRGDTPYGLQHRLESKVESGQFWPLSLNFYLWHIGLFLLGLGVYLLLARYRKEREDQARYNATRAGRFAIKQLRSAAKYLEKEETDNFFLALEKSLWGYASNKYGLPLSSLDRASLEASMRERGIPEELIDRYISLLDVAQAARYAPAESKASRSYYEEALSILTALEEVKV